jgi:hypothetical protein
LLQPLRPALLRRRSKNAADLVKLIGLVGAWKEWPQRVQLGHHSSGRPQIHRATVAGLTQEHLWGSIPACGNIVRERRTGADFTGKTEIREFHSVARDEHVLRLQVSVKVPVLVHPTQGLERLVDNVPNFRLRQNLHPVLDHLVNVAVHIFADEVQLVVFSDDLLELHNVRVDELA